VPGTDLAPYLGGIKGSLNSATWRRTGPKSAGCGIGAYRSGESPSRLLPPLPPPCRIRLFRIMLYGVNGGLNRQKPA
jgi:hypothetical protein